MNYTLADEQHQCSNYSPGIVGEEEQLLRILFHPEHINDQNEIASSAVSTDDLRVRGLSVYRKLHASKDMISDNISNQQQKANMSNQRNSASLAVLVCSDVRSFVFNDERSFIVIDDALEDNISHASIYSAYPRKKSELRKIRIQLISLMEDRYSLDQVFKEDQYLSARSNSIVNSLNDFIHKCLRFLTKAFMNK
jgi:hypothetical protein